MITFAITVADEEAEFSRLLDSLSPYLLEGETILVLADEKKVTPKIIEICKQRSIEQYFFDFRGNFSEFKNEILKKASTNYIFQIDADEQIPPSLVVTLRLLAAKGEYDCYAIPRINIVRGITEDHLIKYGWRINERGWIQFPDFQVRFFKNNGRIRWEGKVHEQIIGYEKIAGIQSDPIENFCILHVKDILKQEKQNLLYEKI